MRAGDLKLLLVHRQVELGVPHDRGNRVNWNKPAVTARGREPA